ncbi:MAG: M56 family metallopeptidase [Planctomycetaceae bacterium]
MIAIQFLELFISLSLQATLVVVATYWIGHWTENERTKCGLWTACYILLLLLVVCGVFLPHVRLLQPMRPLTRPTAFEIVTLETQLGRFLLYGWLIGCGGSLVLFMFRSIQAERFIRSCKAVEPDVVSLDENVDDDPQIHERTVRLVSTVRTTTPFCWQFHQPYIVIPHQLLTYERDELKYVLRHELAHLRTGHPMQLFLQRSVEILFWYHPMVWWAARESGLDREFMCDDEVVQSRADIVRYLKTLLTIVEQTTSEDRAKASLAFVRNRCELVERARRLVRIAQQAAESDRRQPARRLTAKGATIVLTVAACAATLLWLPVNLLASPGAQWSPWPSWTSRMLNDVGIKTRDFEVYDHRYTLHEILFSDERKVERPAIRPPAAD